ncbi:abortive phage infection protein [Streptomyces sp. Je 1-369]|uniref:abortive phage infection protein n=1 Tax=Streptomyces sp. Je 1-369 TaxID=2966192 RepID=UPI0022864434|nr:abortive phage infection protein [Streptomyces sp. Je 1-369]WAL96740.1 abortive phage infection protein [Streptomyces sp. Je 1-369]
MRDDVGGISRGRFLVGSAAVGAAVATGALTAGAGKAAAGVAPLDGAGDRRGLRYRGVCYEVGDGDGPATAWSAGRMRRDLHAIRHELHANSVSVYGTGVDRLAATASEAAERGLHVWLQPRLADVPERDILDHLAETGRHAERMRRQGARVYLSVGCEFVLFVPGIVPGDDALERVQNILKGNYDPQHMAREVRRFVGLAAKTGRRVFRGPLTYGAAHDDDVDWSLFDLISVNYYGYHGNAKGYVKDLTPHTRWGKPVAITECGSCTYEGAPQDGGMGWYESIDYTADPPEITGALVRSERTQAAYLSDVFDVFESMNLHAALVYQFVSPELPHRPDSPRHDLDVASYGLAKALRKRPDDPASPWHWEPKESFRALAHRFARAERR